MPGLPIARDLGNRLDIWGLDLTEQPLFETRDDTSLGLPECGDIFNGLDVVLGKRFADLLLCGDCGSRRVVTDRVSAGVSPLGEEDDCISSSLGGQLVMRERVQVCPVQLMEELRHKEPAQETGHARVVGRVFKLAKHHLPEAIQEIHLREGCDHLGRLYELERAFLSVTVA